MTTYYVDTTALGTGDGLSPTNAFIAIQSVPFADNAWVWVRNTHREVYPQGFTLGNSWAADWFMKRSYIVGWPTSGSPYYNERPAAGVSASWDSDVPATAAYSLAGYKMPTLVGSNFLLIGNGTHIANFYLSNSNGSAVATGYWVLPGRSFIPTARLVTFDNIVPLYREGPIRSFGTNQGYVRRVTLIASVSPTDVFDTIIAQALGADQVIISSLSMGCLMQHQGLRQIRIGHLHNYSNSINNVGGGGGAQDDFQYLYPAIIRRVSGVLPYSGDASGQSSDSQQPIYVDDYYGQGPRIIGDPFCGTMRVPSLQVAAHSGEQVMQYAVASVNTANQLYEHITANNPMVRAFFNTVSGTPLNIQVPLYTDSTNIFSLSLGTTYGVLGCAGGFPYPVGSLELSAGVAAEWGGTLISGGSAYVAAFSFTPLETSSNVPFDFFIGPPLNTTSGAGLTAYLFAGKPH